ncbi:MAG: restriction endonuclease subunit S [Methylohalobius sp.]|nr:restriction endonuclease subunit S [Methylohalobius sp.]
MQGKWQEVSVGDLCPFAYGKGLPEEHRNATGQVPVYGSNGVVGFHNSPLTDGPTVVVGRKGTAGAVHYSPVPCWPIDTTFYVTGKESSLIRYLYYLLKSLGLEHMNADSAVPGLNRDAAHSRRVLIPETVTEQRAIAHILGTLDDKIELNRRMSETLEGMARALFKSWFVDFDPVRAKMEGRWQRGQTLPGLPVDTYDLWPDRLVPSEMGEIPEGWEVKSFADTVEIIGGGTPKTSVPEYWNGDIPWFSVVDAPATSDVWVLDTEKKITHAGIANSSTRILPVGTTIISARGTVGRLALVGVPMAMNQSCYGLLGKLGKRGFFNYFATRQLVSVLQQRTHGSVFDTITRDTLAGVQVSVPPVGVVEVFELGVGPFLERLRNAIAESRTLAALRDALLPKLISGQIRVKDAERFLKDRGL